LCGAKTAGFSIEVQNPAPQGDKLPIDQERRLAVTDACIKRASTCMPPTNFTAIDDDVDVDVDVSQNEDASGHRSR